MDMRQKVACPICGELQLAFWLDSHLVSYHNCGYSEEHYVCTQDCFFCGERFTDYSKNNSVEEACEAYYRHYQECKSYHACLLAGAVVVDHRERWNE